MQVRAIRIVRQIYRLLLALYPPVFRREFGGEMEDVFTQLSVEARQRGGRDLALALWGELVDLPASLLTQYWLAMVRKEGIMSGSAQLGKLLDEEYSAAGGDGSPAPWSQALLAAAPFLILLPLMTVSKLLALAGVTTWGSRLLSVVDGFFALLAIGSVLASLVVAWRGKWPRWSATWFTIYWLVAFIPLLWLSALFENTSLAADVFSELFGFFLLPMLIAGGLYYVARHDPLKSLLAVIPVLVIIWLPHTEFVPDGIEVPATVFSLLVAALAAALVTRLGNWRTGIWLLLLAAALIGMPFAYMGIYHGGTLPFSAAGPSPLEVMRSFTPYYLMASTLIIGPLLAACYRVVGRQAGRGGEFCYHLALFGILLVIGAALASFFFENESRLPALEYGSGSWLTIIWWLGLLAYLAGAVSLGWLARRKGALTGWVEFIALSLLILTLPLVLLLPVFAGWGGDRGLLGGLNQFYDLQPSLDFILGFAWLLLAGWLLTRRETPQKMQIA